MRSAVVIGTGGHSRVIISMLINIGTHNILDIVELAELKDGETILGFP